MKFNTFWGAVHLLAVVGTGCAWFGWAYLGFLGIGVAIYVGCLLLQYLSRS